MTVQNSGTYNVAPWGIQTSAPQVLKVQRGTGNPDWLWIEYHQPTGNYEADMKPAFAFFRTLTPRHPERAGFPDGC